MVVDRGKISFKEVGFSIRVCARHIAPYSLPGEMKKELTA